MSRSPTAADVEDHLAREYADASQEERAAALADLRDMPRVEPFPAFRRIVGDRLGFLWVEEYPMPGGKDDAVPLWTVFDVDGRVRGLVTTPPDLRIFEIGADYILGSTADEFGLEYVQTLDARPRRHLTGNVRCPRIDRGDGESWRERVRRSIGRFLT